MSTYVGSVVIAGVDGRVEELGEMAYSQTSITGSRRRRAALDILKDGLGVGFRDKGCPMVIVPSALLLDMQMFRFGKYGRP